MSKSCPLFFLTLILVSVFCQSNAVGGLAFVGYNGDNNEGFAVVALEDFSAGTSFRFRDDEWTALSGFNTGEGFFSFTPSQDVVAGTVLRFEGIDSTSKSVVDGNGVSISGAFAGVNIDLNVSDEYFYAYLGTDFDTVTRQLSSLRTDSIASVELFGNSDGANIDFGATGYRDGDVMFYTGFQSGLASFESYISLIEDRTNWTVIDQTGDQSDMWSPPSGVFSVVPEPTSLAYAFLALSTLGIRRRRRLV